jgi:hypothetical protein
MTRNDPESVDYPFSHPYDNQMIVKIAARITLKHLLDPSEFSTLFLRPPKGHPRLSPFRQIVPHTISPLTQRVSPAKRMCVNLRSEDWVLGMATE